VLELKFIGALIDGAYDHIWLVFVAFLISFAILRWRKINYFVESASLWTLVGLLALFAIVPTGLYALFTPTVAQQGFDEVKNLPNYTALLTADVILVFLGFIGGSRLA
jgi:hypothetical protein